MGCKGEETKQTAHEPTELFPWRAMGTNQLDAMCRGQAGQLTRQRLEKFGGIRTQWEQSYWLQVEQTWGEA